MSKTTKPRLVNPAATETIYESFESSQAVVAGDRVDVADQVGVTLDLKIPDGITDQASAVLDG